MGRNYKREHKEINILVVAHRTELLDQISATLSRFGIAHGFIQGAREQHLWKRVQVGSIMSLLTDKNYYNVCRQRFDYIIVDEAHHSLADTYMKLFNLFPEAKKLGVTATPWRLNHESFLSLYQRLITSPQISWFINKGLLADFDYVSIKPNSEVQKLVNNSEVASTGDFSNTDLDNTFNNQRIRAKVYESYEKFAKGRQGIIYAINKRHAANIAELYSSHGVNAVAVDCDTPKEVRHDLISSFKEGKIKVLVNVDIFTEGFDCPSVSFIQLARPTKSLALYIQQVGRGLRVVEGKEKTIIIDNVGLYNYFGLPDANRKWLYHFKGHEDVVHEENSRLFSNEGEFVAEVDESRFREDNERMMVVRGAQDASTDDSAEPKKALRQKMEIKEFSLCDYYLVRGTEMAFKVYPFVKKHGKSTEAVGNCVYEYNEKAKRIVFGTDTLKNHAIANTNIKLQSLLSFVAMLASISYDDILDISKLYPNVSQDEMTLFEMLEAISKYKKQ
ncbi:MAG: DEAD/DEAH box helicase [Prevotella pectinovora]|uniref:DEAD/DEAH box helicase n=1 Tax=Prevotella pectinovora TaxID=1602169 RepID=UPI002A8113DD|nr:DEAD/DEAH box helicase [Prevotella pectinovora]MDY4779045.1 DEAD/DEAH box helicase [Prevotella pectinovora]